MFGRRLLCFWGQFVGTYSALAYAAHAAWGERTRLVRCGFATETSVGRTVAWACPVHAHATALIKVIQDWDSNLDSHGGTSVPSRVGFVEVDGRCGCRESIRQVPSRYRTIVELAAATTTASGMRVMSEWDQGRYPPGSEVSEKEVAALPITPADWHGEWNYTIAAAPTRRRITHK